MLLGEFQHTIDSKGRLSIPVKFREYFNSQPSPTIVITLTSGPCLSAFSKFEFDVFREKAKNLKKDRNAIDTLRMLYKNATECILDKQGRILIPPNLRKYAELDDNATLLGLDNKFEIWKPETWQEREAALSQNIQDMETILATLGM